MGGSGRGQSSTLKEMLESQMQGNMYENNQAVSKKDAVNNYRMEVFEDGFDDAAAADNYDDIRMI